MSISFFRAVALGILCLLTPTIAAADGPQLLIDAGTGHVLAASHADASWHPASLTKLMTVHLALKAVDDGQLSMGSAIRLSAHAASQPPSKLGIQKGQAITLQQALEVMLVKSANDIAVAVGEAVGGSEKAFTAMMNDEARNLGMTATRFTNASGLPDREQVTTARDMAVLALSILNSHPAHAELFGMQKTSAAGMTFRNTNGMLGHYPGMDGMKTGFICSSGFNITATAERDGRKILAIVLGAPSTAKREAATRRLLDMGFSMPPTAGTRLASYAVASPRPATDLRPHACGRKWKGFAPPEALGKTLEKEVTRF